jgi:hypothetical protein
MRRLLLFIQAIIIMLAQFMDEDDTGDEDEHGPEPTH